MGIKRKLVIGPVIDEDFHKSKYTAFFNGVELPFIDKVTINTATGYPSTVTLTFTVHEKDDECVKLVSLIKSPKDLE